MANDSKYRQLADDLEVAIRAEEYRPGSFLPGERLLCERFQLSRVTVRNALNLLVEKGRLLVVAGRGYQVAGATPCRPRTQLIAGLFPAPQNELEGMDVPLRLTHAASVVLESDGYNLLIANSGDDLEQERECLRNLWKRGVDGIVAMPALTGGCRRSMPDDTGNYSAFLELQARGLPVVLLDRQLAGSGVPGVYNDDIAGGAMQAEYLLKRGFRQVVWFEWTRGRISSLRFAGYQRAMRAAGLLPLLWEPSDFCIQSEWTAPSGRHEAEILPLLPAINQDTALICSSFLVPALEKLFPDHRYRGHRVEWVGYDFGAGSAGIICRPFPYVRRPIQRIGELGARKLLALLHGDASAATADLIAPEMIQ